MSPPLLPLALASDMLDLAAYLVTSTHWTWQYVSDGTTLIMDYTAYGPGSYTSGQAGPGYLDNNGAWFTLRETGGGTRSLLTQRGVGTVQSWTVWLADPTAFTLDSQHPGTQRPTSPDEIVVFVSGAPLAQSVAGTVMVDHNYPTPGALRYQAQNGVPVEGATIRIYKKTDFVRGLINNVVAVTLTDANGNWVDPVQLPTGLTYVVQFHKDGLYGPNNLDLVV